MIMMGDEVFFDDDQFDKGNVVEAQLTHLCLDDWIKRRGDDVFEIFVGNKNTHLQTPLCLAVE